MAVNWNNILVVKNDTDSDRSGTETESEDTDNDTDSEEVETHDLEKDTRKLSHNDKQKRLGKRLAYILRYGAHIEGLDVLSGGYVSLTELLNTKLMRHDNKDDILKEVEESSNRQGIKRFEKKIENGNIYVRACYRRMERNPHHEGTQVTRLLEITINYIADHIKYFDLQDFPEEFLINCIIQRLKRSNRLNNAAFESLLGRNNEHLDLSDAVLTEKTLKLVGQRCPHLKQLSLRHCGYIITDHIMEMLLKKLTELESLDLSCCSHLSDRTINAVVKWCPRIVKLNITGIPNISQQALLHFVTACDRLKCLDISQDQKLSEEGMEILTQLTRAHKISLNISGKSLDSV